jgi:Pretoxin HINT domain
MQKESDHTISLYTETEVIETTAQHPFFVNNTWKDASELQPGDKIQTKDKQEVEIKSTQFNYEPKKVFNFTVGNWHTYFVTSLMVLVHNAKKCLSEVVKKLKNGIKDVDKLKRTKHVPNRHISRKKYPTKSKYKKPSQLKKLENRTIKSPDKVTRQGNRTLYQKEYGRVIGNNGEKVHRVVVDEVKKKVVTSFPSAGFK